jgi:hypothetical protein
MYLLYLDDSGSAGNADDKYVILAGVAVFERQTHWLSSKVEEIAARLSPDDPASLEFHGSPMLSGRRAWRKFPKDLRLGAYREALDLLARSTHVTLFGTAVHKRAVAPHDPMERAFEEICNRFDLFLMRLHHNGNTQRGLFVLDKSTYETTLQGLARDFRVNGHRWGQLRNLSEVPLFVDSKATRMIQLADLVAHSLRHYYEHGDARLFDLISGKFDAVGGIVHGLKHIRPPDEHCNCFSCRRRP